MRRSRTPLAVIAAVIGSIPLAPAAAAALQTPSDSAAAAAVPYPLSVDAYRVFTGHGAASSLTEVIQAARAAEVLFLGEMHDDRVGHAIQYDLFRSLIDSLDIDDPAARSPRTPPADKVVLSLEMFERDVQHILDEYLSGLITEDHLHRSGLPWPFYEEDYRPLVELARSRGLRVVAANAPRRYVNRVTREGPSSLDALPAVARATLPPLPYAPPSAAYRERFEEAMAGHRAPNDEEKRDATEAPRYGAEAQALWDAAMAYSIVESLVRDPEALVVHLVGSFHVSWGLGLLEHLERYRPSTRTVTVVIRPVTDPTVFADSLQGIADFVVLTDSSHVRPRATPSATHRTDERIDSLGASVTAEVLTEHCIAEVFDIECRIWTHPLGCPWVVPCPRRNNGAAYEHPNDEITRVDPHSLAERPRAGPATQPWTSLESVPIMIFVGNPGMTQIYSGTVTHLVDTPPWRNVLDPSLNLHVREPGIAQAWVVRKPTRHGIISALDLYDEDEGQIALIVSERESGAEETGAWRGILTSLSREAA